MVKWKLKALLEANNLSAYALSRAAGVAPNTVYGLARGEHERISLKVLSEVIRTLEELTGKRVSVCDLLEYERKEG
jgi:DNA-binding Xre family transcriptional regulator